MNTTRDIERRYLSGDIEVRQYNGDQVRIEGYAARFNSMSSDLGGFVESISNNAFNKTVQEADVRALINHDPNQVLARNKSGTLDLSVDSDGLHYRISPPDTSYSRDLMVSMERGDISNSSFAFRAISDKWGLTDDDYPHRTLNEVGLIDVSVVTYPAYPEASSGIARSAVANIAKRCGLDPDAVTVESLRDFLKEQKRAASVSDKPWGDFSASDYTPEQYKAACLIVTGDTKADMKLPIKEPDGTLNRNAVHAAAGRIGSVDAPHDAVVAAAKTLVGIYKNTLKEDPPEALVSLADGSRSEPEPEVSQVDEPETTDSTSTLLAMRDAYVRVLEEGLDIPLL